jgi:tetratricopeptide (TPR) repeat protein
MNNQAVHVRSGASAFRADAARDAVEAAGRSREGLWIAVTTLLEHASVVASHDRQRLLDRAIELARESLGDDPVRRRSEREWRDERTPSDVVTLLAEDAYEAGAFNTALAMVGALERADTTLTPVQRGRLLVRRARAIARLGRLDDARDHFLAVRRLGRETDSPELVARGWLGLGSVAQMSGDYVAMDSFSRSALRVARARGLDYAERYAHLGIMISAGQRGDFDTALVHGWAVYRASEGRPMEEGEILQSFGQLMSMAGYFDEARAAFGAVVARALPARILIPALGGLSLAAAQTGRSATVRWVANQLTLLDDSGTPRYVTALALLECSDALARIGQPVPARELRERARAIAEQHGFHEVTTRVEQSRRGDEPTTVFTLGGRGTRIAGRIASLEPGRLPDEVSVLVVPA